MNNKKIILVDRLDSALGIAAARRASVVNADVVAIMNFRTPKQLAIFLDSGKYDLMVFSWRRGLLEAMCSPNFRKFISANRTKTKIGLVVADYLGLDKRFFEQERHLINYVDVYWTTNQELFDKYSFTEKISSPIGVLHDIPDYVNIVKIRNEKIKKNRLIWVGNSGWGSNYGVKDHKGFREIIEPLFIKLRGIIPDYEFCIIDSFEKSRSNLEVLNYIAESRIILQASVNEGTGLPFLEGIGLGTIPITTDVGVASELLRKDFSNLLVDRSVDSFAEAICKTLNEDFGRIDTLIEIFESHIRKIVAESMECSSTSTNHRYKGNTRIMNLFRIYLLWRFRNYRVRRLGEN